MICPPCHDAGRALLLKMSEQQVRDHHNECESPESCTCQHEIMPPGAALSRRN